MQPRDAALAAALIFIAGLAFLTLRVLVSEGFDILVAVSLLVLALLGFGVLGALTSGDDR